MTDFSVEGSTSLDSIKKGSKVHFLGIAGIAMAQLAVYLSNQGFQVSGNDTDFWEPAGSLLNNSNIKLFKGYEELPEHDLVVIGNAIRRDNPLLSKVVRYTTFPQALYETIIKGRRSIVISGTHGKTTTTALTAWCLKDQDPSYFIGGSVIGLESSLHVGKGNLSVVEGDEYDSAFFAKVPKFDFYKPDILLVTSVEFDHADIYPNIEAINREFTELVASTTDAVVVAMSGDNLKKLSREWSCKTRLITYGLEGDVTFSRANNSIFFNYQGEQVEIKLNLTGEHNAFNAVGSWLVQKLAGVSNPSGFDTFQGVKRRQEIKFKSEKLIIIDDFAHHPTAVRQTLKGLRERYSDRKMIVCFEPRSNTSRRKIFEGEYRTALSIADCVIVKRVIPRHNDNIIDLFDVDTLVKSIGGVALFETDEIVAKVNENLSGHDLVVVMSNGSFDGLVESLTVDLPK